MADLVEQLGGVGVVVDKCRLDSAAVPALADRVLTCAPHGRRCLFEVALSDEDSGVASGGGAVAVEVPDQVGVGEARSNEEAERVLEALGDVLFLPRAPTLHAVVVLLGQDELLGCALSTGIPVQVGDGDCASGRFGAPADIRLDLTLVCARAEERALDEIVIIGGQDRDAVAGAGSQLRNLVCDGARLVAGWASVAIQSLRKQRVEIFVRHDLDNRAGAE